MGHDVDEIDGFVPREISGHLRFSGHREIARRRTQHRAHAANADRGKGGIRQVGDAHSDIDAFVEEMHYPVDEQGIDGNIRVAVQQIDEYRRQNDTAEQRRSR